MNPVDVKYQFCYTPCIRNLLFPITNIFETWPFFEELVSPILGFGKFGQMDKHRRFKLEGDY